MEGLGWQAIFDKYDADMSGELEIDEFTAAVREVPSSDDQYTAPVAHFAATEARRPRALALLTRS